MRRIVAMSIGAWIFLTLGIGLLVQLVREALRPSEERSIKRIVTHTLFLLVCIYVFLSKLGLVPRI